MLKNVIMDLFFLFTNVLIISRSLITIIPHFLSMEFESAVEVIFISPLNMSLYMHCLPFVQYLQQKCAIL